MSDREISPLQDPPHSEEAGHYRADDDIELPPITESAAGSRAATDWSSDSGRGSSRKRISSLVGVAVLVGALAVGGWFVSLNGSGERGHQNWQHVAAADEASGTNTNQFVQVEAAGNSQVVPSIEVTSADAIRRTTQRVRSALQRGDLVTANAHLQAAQGLPTASQNPDVQQPALAADSDMVSALEEGSQELFEIELFDCCDEDGDIVEVHVNGTRFATVPILHGGTKLSIPLARGNNTVTIRGVKDGRGGVTLSFRTSRGDYFARSMRVGQQYQMGVVVR